jgi:hypothetical protein
MTQIKQMSCHQQPNIPIDYGIERVKMVGIMPNVIAEESRG